MGFRSALKAATAAIPAVALAAALAVPTSAHAVTQLGFLLDDSGSIGSGNWTTIVTGLANAINSIVPTDSSYEISVVRFDTNAATIVNHVLIDSAATRSTVASAISAASYLGGSTDMAAGFNMLTSVLTGSTLFTKDGTSYVNLATDGVPNSQPATNTAQAAMVTAGIDNISIEAIGSGVDPVYLKTALCYPLACDDTAPYDFPAKGFYLAVANADEYATAIQTKVRIVTNQVPEPATMALLGTGLLGLGALRRRRG